MPTAAPTILRIFDIYRFSKYWNTFNR